MPDDVAGELSRVRPERWADRHRPSGDLIDE